MSQHRLSPITTRPSSNALPGEKSTALPDAIPEESAATSKEADAKIEEDKPAAERGWFSLLKLDMTKTEWDILIASTCFKLLLFPA